jgi:hypothetical protein
VCSGFRSFERQVEIWNRKVEALQPRVPQEIFEAILRWSALPGTSRHHWGTELDVIDGSRITAGMKVNLVPEEFGLVFRFEKDATKSDNGFLCLRGGRSVPLRAQRTLEGSFLTPSILLQDAGMLQRDFFEFFFKKVKATRLRRVSFRKKSGGSDHTTATLEVFENVRLLKFVSSLTTHPHSLTFPIKIRIAPFFGFVSAKNPNPLFFVVISFH